MIYIFLTCHIQSFRKSGLPSQNIQNSIISNDLDYQCLGPSCHHLSPELQETLKKSLSFNYWFSIVKNQWTLCASLLLPCSKWVFTTVPYPFLVVVWVGITDCLYIHRPSHQKNCFWETTHKNSQPDLDQVYRRDPGLGRKVGIFC